MTSISEPRDRSGTPPYFLLRTRQHLKKKNIAPSLKRSKGGSALTKPAGGIKLLEFVKAIDSDHLFWKCTMGFPECSSETPRTIHEH